MMRAMIRSMFLPRTICLAPRVLCTLAPPPAQEVVIEAEEEESRPRLLAPVRHLLADAVSRGYAKYNSQGWRVPLLTPSSSPLLTLPLFCTSPPSSALLLITTPSCIAARLFGKSPPSIASPVHSRWPGSTV